MYWRILDAFESPLYLLRCAARDNVIRVMYSIEDGYRIKGEMPFEHRFESNDNYFPVDSPPTHRLHFRVTLRFESPRDFNRYEFMQELRHIFLLFKPDANYTVYKGSIRRGTDTMAYVTSPFKGYFENLLWSLADRDCPLLFKDSWLFTAFKTDVPIVLSSARVCHRHWLRYCSSCPVGAGYFDFEVTPVTQFYQLVAKLNIMNPRYQEILAAHREVVRQVRDLSAISGNFGHLNFPSWGALKEMHPFVALIESLRLSFWGTLPTDENKFVLSWAGRTFPWASFLDDHWHGNRLENLLSIIDDPVIRKYRDLLVDKSAWKVNNDQIERAIASAFRPEIIVNGRPVYSFRYSRSNWKKKGGTVTFRFGFSHPMAYLRVQGRDYHLSRDPMVFPATDDFALRYRPSGILLGTGIDGGEYTIVQSVKQPPYFEHELACPRLSHLNCTTCNIQLGLSPVADLIQFHRGHHMTCDFGKFILKASSGDGFVNKNNVRSLFVENMGDVHPRSSYPFMNGGVIRMNCVTCKYRSVTVRSYSDGSSHLGHTLVSIFDKEFVLTRSMLRNPLRLLCINRYGMSFYANLVFKTDIVPPSTGPIKGRKRGPPIPISLRGWV